MDNCRKYSRFIVGFECLLRGKANDTYKAFLYDLSYGGAGILVDETTPFQSGDLCELLWSTKQVDFPTIHNCKIIWVDSGKMGLSFLS